MNGLKRLKQYILAEKQEFVEMKADTSMWVERLTPEPSPLGFKFRLQHRAVVRGLLLASGTH